MQPERWQRCAAIFNAALERPHNARGALLEQSCRGDEALRRNVELLLKYHDHSNDFIDSPAFTVAPELLIDGPDALVGQHLGNYRIDALLGVGGMGVVYLACDERLGRMVGLKVLPRSVMAEKTRWERLKQEARTASALNHPNIMTIHEFGEADSSPYIATEFIEGRTLRERIGCGPIPHHEAVEIAVQVASALCVAHGAGIVHGDVKPENIMLRPDGYVKVLDFGIATFAPEEGVATSRLTGATVATARPGIILGTARYMSPEQARGDAVDARSDLWSLGVVFYEMLAGTSAFEGRTPADLIAPVLRKHPERFEAPATIVPRPLQRVVERSLRKAPAERYQTAQEMLSALRASQERRHGIVAPPAAGRLRGRLKRSARTTRWIGSAAAAVLFACFALSSGWRERPFDRTDPPAPVEKGIAVLPFENLSPDNEDAFFADAIQDDILTSIGKVKGLKVTARASVMDYRGTHRAGKIREIGRSLGVSHLLEGSVRRAGDRVVVNVALIDARAERRVWAERYDRTLTDSISLQGELAMEITRALQTTLTPAETTVVTARPTQNPEAYLLYLRAHEIEIRSPTGLASLPAIALYQQAIDLDPDFALAHARFSLCASQLGHHDPAPAWRMKARAEAEEAVRLRPRLGEARLARAQCYLWGDRDVDRAMAELNETAELLPNSAEVHLTAAYIYKRQDKYRERIAALHRAEALDPRNRTVLWLLANTNRWLRNWPEALQRFDRFSVVAQPQTDPAKRYWCRANDEFRLTGDINALRRAINQEANDPTPARAGWLNVARFETAMLERDYTTAARFLSAIPPETFSEAISENRGHSKAFHQALLAVARDEPEADKRRALTVAREEVEKRLVWKDGTPDEKAYADLALIHAFLGRKEDAVSTALHAVDVTARALSFGVIEKNDILSALAMVYAQTGEHDKAIDLIARLLTAPTEVQRGAVYNMTLTDLKWRWQWDPLRTRPAFEKLLSLPEPATVY
jgi:TolB-like protein/Tfp pilus assembly protein PilF